MPDNIKSGKALELHVADAYRHLGARKVEHDVELAGNQIDVYVELATHGAASSTVLRLKSRIWLSQQASP